MKNIKRSVRILLIIIACILAFFAVFTVINLIGCRAIFHEIDKIDYSSPSKATFTKATESDVATVKMAAGIDELKILQISDIHFCCSIFTINNDRKAVKAVAKLVAATNPDLIVLTGDMTFPVYYTGSINNYICVEAICEMMESFNIPWTVVYGNHDAEGIAMMNKTKQSAEYSKQPHSLFTSGPSALDGQGNYVINLLNNDGTVNTALYMLDGNSYGEDTKYDYIHDNQVEWYKQQVHNSSAAQSLMFVHIPLYQYRTAYELYEQNSSEVTYLRGVKKENICSEDNNVGKMFDAITSTGNTKGVFVGHDHTNNFAIQYKGVTLAYGMSIDHIAYPGIGRKSEQRGGQLITVSNGGEIRIALCPQDSDFAPQQSFKIN